MIPKYLLAVTDGVKIFYFALETISPLVNPNQVDTAYRQATKSQAHRKISALILDKQYEIKPIVVNQKVIHA